MENKENRSCEEIWSGGQEIFPPGFGRDKKRTGQEAAKKKERRRKKFLLTPFIVFFIVGVMLGDTEEYEYKQVIEYTVVAGDTLWDISRRYLGRGYQYIEIAAFNEIENPDLIYAGDKFWIVITRKGTRRRGYEP